MKRTKELWVLLGSICFSLLLLEMLTRVFFPQTLLYNRFHSVADYGDYVTRRLQPNTTFIHRSMGGTWEFRINAQGFRMDRDVREQKAPDTFRVLILGDSHTQGMEVSQERTFSHLLGGMKCHHVAIEAINGGISGSGTSEHLIMLKSLFDRFRPDLVVEAFYPNDLDNNFNAFHALEGGTVREIRSVHPAWKGTKILEIHNKFFLTNWLSQHSFAYSIVLNSIWERAKYIFYKHKITDNVELASDSDIPMDKRILMFNLLIQEMNRYVDSKGAKFVVINIASEVDYEWSRFLLEESRDFVLNIDYPKDQRLHVQNGLNHINERAHEIIAERLFGYICEILRRDSGPSNEHGA
jgi:hypothetical protein